jgi:mono/diheme cytochrome c family protein
MMKRLLILVLPLALAWSLCLSAQVFVKSMWDGVFTSADAARGQSDYLQMCSSCHGADLKGKGTAPALTGPGFFRRWEHLSVFDL